MQTYEQGQVCYLTGEHGEAVKHVYLGSQWVPMSAEMESVIKILNDRYSARDAETKRKCAERGLRYYENTAISERSGEGLYEAISGRKRAAIIGEEE